MEQHGGRDRYSKVLPFKWSVGERAMYLFEHLLKALGSDVGQYCGEIIINASEWVNFYDVSNTQYQFRIQVTEFERTLYVSSGLSYGSFLRDKSALPLDVVKESASLPLLMSLAAGEVEYFEAHKMFIIPAVKGEYWEWSILDNARWDI